jgi:hypothetical protein
MSDGTIERDICTNAGDQAQRLWKLEQDNRKLREDLTSLSGLVDDLLAVVKGKAA